MRIQHDWGQEMSKVCSFCGNKNFKAKKVQYIYKYNDRSLIVNDVPCEECESCGEQYFGANILKRIERYFTEKLGQALDPSKDPILKLIGLADVEPFADKIDDILYGNQ